MSDFEWQKVKELFDIALQLKPQQRQSYVKAACGENLSLRSEVESLLDSFDPDFIESPAVSEVADLIVEDDIESKLISGQALAHYQIIKRIGKGGMGNVYLAEDTKLNRQVALKVLSARLEAGRQHFQRFVREAQSASSLNHPNICTIYEINDEGELPFIAMEYVEGETLGKRIKEKRLTLSEIYDLAMQIIAALTAAHAAKIVHRDIKPENIMIRSDGLIKVLDFGLAKLSEKTPSVKSSDSGMATMPLVSTNPGMVLGTANYMSPEQARGKDVDTRTDIFSFGIVLYEMISGSLPFSGENDLDLIGSILHRAPVPLDQRLPNAPKGLSELIDKALRKDQEERYQTVIEVGEDLKELFVKLDLKDLSEDPGIRFTDGTDYPQTVGAGRRETVENYSELYTQNRSRISEVFYSELKLRPKSFAALFVLFALVTAIAAVGLFILMQPSRTISSLETMRLTKLTTFGNLEDKEISISPDGKYVAFALEEEGGQQSLWIKQVETEGNVQIVPSSEVKFSGITFSPDGDYIYYAVFEKPGTSAIFMVPALGGEPRKLISDGYGPVTFSPDGSKIAFIRDETQLMTSLRDGSSTELLAATAVGERWLHPAWSPDGTAIASVIFSSAGSEYRLVEVAIGLGTVKSVPDSHWLSVSGLSWLADGSGLILSGRDFETMLSQIWFVSYPGGESRRLVNDLSNYQGLSVTPDGGKAVSVQQNLISNLWISSDSDSDSAQQITSEVGREQGLSGIAWAPDGRVVYTTRITGTQDLWIVNRDGSENKQLTFDVKSNFSPAVSPNGENIVFISNRTGNIELWSMKIDGTDSRQLTSTPGIEGEPGFSPDGRWIVFQYSDSNNRTTVWKLDLSSGNKIQLTETESGKPVVSPDGNFIACVFGEANENDPMKLAIIPFESGTPVKILNFPKVVKSRTFRWSADGSALIYIDSQDRRFNLWSQPVNGKSPVQLTDFKSDRIFRFDFAPTRKEFAFVRGDESSDAVIIRNFR